METDCKSLRHRQANIAFCKKHRFIAVAAERELLVIGNPRHLLPLSGFGVLHISAVPFIEIGLADIVKECGDGNAIIDHLPLPLGKRLSIPLNFREVCVVQTHKYVD